MSRVVFAIPTHDDRIHTVTMETVFAEAQSLISSGVGVDMVTRRLSTVNRARDELAAEFLRNKAATHLMFIDADVGWPPGTILRMLDAPYDITASVYPRRETTLSFPVQLKPSSERHSNHVKVSAVAAGCMLIKRRVIEKLSSAAFQYLDKRRNSVARIFYDDVIDGELYTEDYAFCVRAQKAGFTVGALTNIEMTHSGPFDYRGTFTVHKKTPKRGTT